MVSIKNKIRKYQKKIDLTSIEWYNLKKGDSIKVFNGHGPYMLINGIKHYTGVPGGIYIVHKITEEGIHVHCKDGLSHSFIYMGAKKDSILGYSQPHKIKKIK